jgi:hypothetical protein
MFSLHRNNTNNVSKIVGYLADKWNAQIDKNTPERYLSISVAEVLCSNQPPCKISKGKTAYIPLFRPMVW